MSVIEQEVEFQSQGVVCRGLFVRPNSARPAPLLVLAHGLGGIYEMRLDAYARRFAEAGYAALTFDYRFFGRSDGLPRHLLTRKQQQQDIAAATDFGKTLHGVDGSRVVLWGTSLAGGHMLDVTSARTDIAATIIQAPFTDGVASVRATSLISILGISLFVVADAVSRLLGRPPVLVPLAAPPLLPALMTKPDVVQGVLNIFPQGSHLSGRLSSLYRTFAEHRMKLGNNVAQSTLAEPFSDANFVGSIILPSGTSLINGVSANFGFAIFFWRPGKKLKGLRSPVLVCACEQDSVAPSKQTIAFAKAAPSCELKVYPYGHFDIYTGEQFEIVIKDQLAFLARVVPVQSGTDARDAGEPPAGHASSASISE